MRLRLARLVGLPDADALPHLDGLARALGASARAVPDARRPRVLALAAEARAEAAVLRARLRDRPRVRREREEDRFILVAPGGGRFVARRRQDRGRGWTLVAPWGGALGHFETLEACEAAVAAHAASQSQPPPMRTS